MQFGSSSSLKAYQSKFSRKLILPLFQGIYVSPINCIRMCLREPP
jgi:hypothetical protein